MSNSNVEIPQHSREDIQDMFANPVYMRMRLELFKTKEELYDKATAGTGTAEDVKSCMDKIAAIDGFFAEEQNYVDEFNEGAQ